MSVNGVTGAGAAPLYQTYDADRVKAAQTKAEQTGNVDQKAESAAAAGEGAGAVYEKSTEAQSTIGATKYKPNAALIEQLKADTQARVDQLTDIVQKMMGKQAGTSALAGGGDDVWKFLASGKFQNVDEAARAQAQKDIAEDGYWGVKQTSSRILDFAKALTGGDPDKIEDMRNAFKKGYSQATKAWGQDLPDISSQTYDAVMKGFDSWKEESQKAAGPQAAQQSQDAARQAAETAQQNQAVRQAEQTQVIQ